MKFSEYKLLASNFVVLYKENNLLKLTTEELKKYMGIDKKVAEIIMKLKEIKYKYAESYEEMEAANNTNNEGVAV